MGRTLRCEAVDNKESYLRCDNGKFYKIKQKSYNAQANLNDLNIYSSRNQKKIESESIPSNSINSPSTISK